MDTTPNDGYFEAYWPRGAARVTSKKMAPRLPSLDGKRIAFLWDFIFRGDEMFATLEEALRQRYQDMSFVGWDEMGNIHGNDERQVVATLPIRLKEMGVDAVITGVAA